MKHILIIASLYAAIGMIASSCDRGDSAYYELVGGNKSVDYIEFVSDSTCKFVTPGYVEYLSPYEIVNGEYIVVHVAPMSNGILQIVDENTLEGQVPFFEGTWNKTNKPLRRK